MGLVTESGFGKIGDVIVGQIQDRDGLVHERLLRAITVVQQRGEAAVRTQSNIRRKAVGAAHQAGNGDGELLAGRQPDRMFLIVRDGFFRLGKKCAREEEAHGRNAKLASRNHGTSAKTDSKKRRMDEPNLVVSWQSKSEEGGSHPAQMDLRGATGGKAWMRLARIPEFHGPRPARCGGRLTPAPRR